ncbi:DNA-directed RNA polymerase III subunit RPC5-like [Dermacentor albipictus]|uniref:DNA-directed RNA polymerase III subunit RPC5-like n=1 Tax=Dermacentor albipictus TaxID=60249 RepID=UPI0038FCB8C4
MAASSSSGVAADPTEDDDEVVAELDVYVSKALADRLYLVQYPQRKPGGNYDEECIAARVKPGQKKIELEFVSYNDDPSYNAEPARQFTGEATASGADFTAKLEHEPQADAAIEGSQVTVPAASTDLGQTVKKNPLEGAAIVKAEPSTDVTCADQSSPGKQTVGLAEEVAKTEPTVAAINDEFTELELTVTTGANQPLWVPNATSVGPVNDVNVEPGTSDGVRRSIKAEPDSKNCLRQSIEQEPTTCGATHERSANVRTSPPSTGTTNHCDGGARTSTHRRAITSTVSTTHPENYAVGLLLPGELHLTPLHAIVRMEPALHHPADQSSDADAKTMPIAPAPDESSGIEPERGYANDDLTTQAQLCGSDNRADERHPRTRQRRFAQMQRENESEPWVDATIHYFDSETCRAERELLVGPRSERERHVSSIPGEHYVRRLLTEQTTAKHPNEARSQTHAAPDAFGTPQLSMHAISCLPLEDQITAVLRNVKVIDFAKLMSVLPNTADEEAVLHILQYAAVLVQGVWVVKSEELYLGNDFSKRTGVRLETLCNARDLLLYVYTQKRHVVESAFADTLRRGFCSLPGEYLRALLEDIARPTPDGWEFLLPYDSDFTEAHPDVVLKQQRVWNDRRVALSRTFRMDVPSVMSRLQERQMGHLGSPSNDAAGNKAPRRRTTPKTVESSPRSSCGSPVAKLSKTAE